MRFAKVAAASAAVLLLAGACGGGGEESGSGDVPKELTVWVMGDSQPKLVDYFKEVDAAWKEKHPESSVKAEFIPWADVQKTLTTALAGGDAPDVLEVGNDQVSNWASQGALLDITKPTEEWGDAKDMDQAALEYGRFDGVQYGVPWFSGVRTLYYRADWLKDLGLEAPTDWKSLVDVAKKIQDEKDVPGFCAPTDFTNGIASFIWSNGGEIAVQDGDKWEGRLTDAKTKEAIEFYAGLNSKEKVSPKGAMNANELDACLPEMANGKLGMYIDGSWARGAMEETAEDKKVVDEIATVPMPGADGIAPAMAGGSDLAVFADGESTEAATELMLLLGNKEWGDKYAEAAGFFPAYPEMLDDEKYTKTGDAKASAEQAKNTKFFPATPKWNKADLDQKILPKAVLSIAKGEDADKVLKDANDELTKTLNEKVE
ncbi:N,N'-diacetylchitobiose transport system substrate-binding protein [Murinocardiopsis flavida]|uniref:N,N'-diacetylchitobiose transport system substrate-binding protein n=1 Tax=Murinocardiopsis flavida TaxID=645275 RepID=A0A2P8DUV2_9ACTN|nr:extracellular solute-binding protein [Murinocardiopsis flavida]PSL00996.1 N,N'-diacetylchitobiose transport system substrate-binding protein [Murinocardiopsis flavida]